MSTMVRSLSFHFFGDYPEFLQGNLIYLICMYFRAYICHLINACSARAGHSEFHQEHTCLTSKGMCCKGSLLLFYCSISFHVHFNLSFPLPRKITINFYSSWETTPKVGGGAGEKLSSLLSAIYFQVLYRSVGLTLNLQFVFFTNVNFKYLQKLCILGSTHTFLKQPATTKGNHLCL